MVLLVQEVRKSAFLPTNYDDYFNNSGINEIEGLSREASGHFKKYWERVLEAHKAFLLKKLAKEKVEGAKKMIYCVSLTVYSVSEFNYYFIPWVRQAKREEGMPFLNRMEDKRVFEKWSENLINYASASFNASINKKYFTKFKKLYKNFEKKRFRIVKVLTTSFDESIENVRENNFRVLPIDETIFEHLKGSVENAIEYNDKATGNGKNIYKKINKDLINSLQSDNGLKLNLFKGGTQEDLGMVESDLGGVVQQLLKMKETRNPGYPNYLQRELVKDKNYSLLQQLFYQTFQEKSAEFNKVNKEVWKDIFSFYKANEKREIIEEYLTKIAENYKSPFDKFLYDTTMIISSGISGIVFFANLEQSSKYWSDVEKSLYKDRLERLRTRLLSSN